MPRFGLTFTSDASSKKLYCNQIKGYYIDPTSSLPKLGPYSHYLVLQNDKGQKKAVFADQLFKKPKKYEVMFPHFNINQQVEIEEGNPQNILFMIFQKRECLYQNLRKQIFT